MRLGRLHPGLRGMIGPAMLLLGAVAGGPVQGADAPARVAAPETATIASTLEGPVEPPEARPEAALRLDALLSELDTLSARFEQTVVDRRGGQLRRASGRLRALRPDRFRWEIEAPFAELLVGDGEELYLWDPDLEQLTIRPYDARMASTPARLLAGSAEAVSAAFEVSETFAEGERVAFELRPKDPAALFERLEMVFAAGLPQRLVIHDSLGQRTEVRLFEVQADLMLEPSLFTFDVPPGADVLREGFDAVPAAGGDG